MDTLHDFIAENQTELMKTVELAERRQIELKSVGCALDVDSLLVYAISHDGNVVHYDGVHITDVSDEWLDRLSEVDNWLLKIMLESILKQL